MAQEVLALLDLKGSERILDVGCGDGKITAKIASRAAKGSVVIRQFDAVDQLTLNATDLAPNTTYRVARADRPDDLITELTTGPTGMGRATAITTLGQ